MTVLLQLHNDLDTAVAEAYGWPADLTDDEILTRLVDLNHERAAEEAQGIIRYLRPEYQNPALRSETAAKTKTKQDKQPWPKTLPKQAKAVQAMLAEMENATPEKVAERFKGAKVQQVRVITETLVALGAG